MTTAKKSPAKKTTKPPVKPVAALPETEAEPRRLQVRLGHSLVWLVVLALLGWFIDAVAPILLPFIVGGVMAYLFDPLADRMERRMKRSYATAIITLGFFSLLVALLAWLGPLLYHQTSQLIAKLPDLMRDLEVLVREQGKPLFGTLNKITGGRADALPKNAGDIMSRGLSLGGQMLLSVLASGGALLNVLSLLLITPIVSFYLLRDWDYGMAKINRLLPLAYAPTIRSLAREINRTLSGYLRGQLYVMSILAVFYIVVLSLIGLKFSLIVGFLAGFLVIVPYLGTLVSTVLGLAIAYSQYEFGPLFWAAAAIFGVGQVLESQILTPQIVGDKVGLHPLWMLFGMLAGGVLLGFIGVLLAVPITAVIAVLVKFLIGLYLDSPLYSEK
jgi:predicted PurR-regulated permease PerM